ncbi:mcm9, partial [Symbiodinium pilosum]
MEAHSKRTQQDLKKRRARSAPAQVDTQDFDAGNVMKNTAVALALQDELSKVLSMECSEGPLNLFWRQGRDEGESAELMRLRFNVGALMLLAAQRSSLPSGLELPLKHFAATETIGVKEELEQSHEHPIGNVDKQSTDVAEPVENRQPLFTTTIADGAFAMGFSVIFHSMPSSHFA